MPIYRYMRIGKALDLVRERQLTWSDEHYNEIDDTEDLASGPLDRYAQIVEQDKPIPIPCAENNWNRPTKDNA